MSGSLSRVTAIIKADFLVRFRRLSTAMIFVGLCISAYLWVPNPATGKTLIQMNEQRALYNSPALAIGTSMLCTLLLTLIGFYMTSNAIKRDVRNRTGFIIASTTVRNWEYILGKFLGNAVFMTAIIAGFMVSAMVMQLVRGEAPLQPLVFLLHYAVMAPPAIAFVSAVAVMFECVPFLSGKFGDIAFFFFWLMSLSLVAIHEKAAYPSWTSYLDTTGMSFMMHQVKNVTHTDELSIGSTSYDMKKPPFVFPGIQIGAIDVMPRLISTLYPLLFLLPALIAFHRFNPARIKAAAQKSHHGWIARINGWLKPLTRRLVPASVITAGGRSFRRSVLADAALTFQLNPIFVLLAIGLSIAAIIQPPGTILPVIFFLFSVILADIATRETLSGTAGLAYTLPFLKQRFILWKWSSVSLVVLLFVAIPMLKMLFANPSGALSLLIALFFTAGVATALGSMTGNPKTFIVVALLFMYIVMNDGGKTPIFDFAGWFGTATAEVKIRYTILAAVFIAAAELQHRWKLQRA